MLVGACAQCGAPASLRCTYCGRTLCHHCLDQDERVCSDCMPLHRQPRGVVGVRQPPSRRVVSAKAPPRIQ
jgi:hypothetical protein